jgi:hypothetical protein
MSTIPSERFLGAILVCALATAAPASAWAQPEPQTSRGTGAQKDPLVPFEEGRALVKAGRYAEALQKFEESIAIKETSGALLNVGDCQEKLGRYASAAKTFRRTQAIAEQGGAPERAKVAAERAAALRAAVSTLTVRVTRKVEGLQISVDGVGVESDVAIELDGGTRYLRVAAPCHRPYEAPVAVGLRGDAREVSVDLVSAPDAPGCPGARPAAPAASKSTSHDARPPSRAEAEERDTRELRRLIAYAAGATGFVVLGVGVGAGIVASSKKSELEDACSSYPRGCPDARRRELDGVASDADTAATISTLGIVSGAVLLGGAGVLFFTARPRRATAQRPLTPLVAPGFAGASASFAF